MKNWKTWLNNAADFLVPRFVTDRMVCVHGVDAEGNEIIMPLCREGDFVPSLCRYEVLDVRALNVFGLALFATIDMPDDSDAPGAST